MDLNYIALLPFICVFVLNIHFVKVKNNKGIYITKPLLMPMLIIFYVLSTTDINWLIVSALIFGCIGDILLMLPRRQFILGLISFLVGHMFYIKAFIDPILNHNIAYIMVFLIIPYIIYNMLVLGRFVPYKKLNNTTKFFGGLYLIVISIMGFSSTIRIFYIEGFKFYSTFIGAMLFITSDCLIALNSVVYNAKNKGAYIMTTYIIAQFLIVLGCI